MRPRRRWWLAGAALLLLIWFARGRSDDASTTAEDDAGAVRTVDRSSAAKLGRALGLLSLPELGAHERAAGAVVVTGTVVERDTREPVGDVEVVFVGPAGERVTTAAADGVYRIELPPGVYRAFVRSDEALTTGMEDTMHWPRWFVPGADVETGVPQARLMRALHVTRDLEIDLDVVRGGLITGRVVDREGRPVAGAMVSADDSGRNRPVLNTDVTVTDADGRYELRVPAGAHDLAATHAQYAALAEPVMVEVEPGGRTQADLTLAAGCIITGRIVGPGGATVTEGTLEGKQQGSPDFWWEGVAGTDGAFRWASTTVSGVTIRARAWSLAPSPTQDFECHDGKRIDGVVFALPPTKPVVAGILVDAQGAPVPFAMIGIQQIGGNGQLLIDRTDARGEWDLFAMPDGRYRLTAYALGRGVTEVVVDSPAPEPVRLVLGGVGRIEATTTLANGTLAVHVSACVDDDGETIAIDDDHRLVAVVDHELVLDDVPACNLAFDVSGHETQGSAMARVRAGGTTKVELVEGASLEGFDDALPSDEPNIDPDNAPDENLIEN